MGSEIKGGVGQQLITNIFNPDGVTPVYNSTYAD